MFNKLKDRIKSLKDLVVTSTTRHFLSLFARPTTDLTPDGFPKIVFPEESSTQVYEFDNLLTAWNNKEKTDVVPSGSILDDIFSQPNVLYPDGYTSGNPPAPGWYYTRVAEGAKPSPIDDLPRWWNGNNWSIYCRETDGAFLAGQFAETPTSYRNDQIVWKEIKI